MNLLRPGIALLFLTLIACSDGNDGNNGGSSIGADEIRPQLDVVSTEPPIELPGISASYSADVRYGDGERNVLDIYLFETDQPTPCIFFMAVGIIREQTASVPIFATFSGGHRHCHDQLLFHRY
jgi:hypothetical protein